MTIIWRIALGVLLVGIWVSPILAQSDTAVRSELSSLRNRVSRLETEVRRLGGARSNRPSPPAQEGEALGASDPMFERLAILVIELKEDVRDLQKRVTVLETKRSP